MRRIRFDHVTPALSRARDALSETGALDAAHDADRAIENAHLELVGHGIKVDKQLTQLELARASMREKLLESLQTFTPEDIGRMIDGSPLVRNRVGLRIKDDPKGAKYDGNKAIKNVDGSYMIHIDQDWMRRVLAEELGEIAETNHQGFVDAFQAAVTADDATLAPMRTALETFVENSHGIDGERASVAARAAEGLATHLLHEPRATLLEWGALVADADLATVGAVAEVMANRAQVQMPHDRDAYDATVGLALGVARAWARAGFPMLAPSHKLAASLMATDTPAALVPELAVPWPTFALLVPDGLLALDSRTIKLIGLTGIDAAFGPQAAARESTKTITVWLANARHTMLYAIPLASIAELADFAPAVLAAMPDLDAQTVAGFTLLGRLLLGAMIELDNPERKESIRRGPPVPKPSGRPGKKKAGRDVEPGRAWTFALTRDVRVDLRHWVRDYVAGGGTRASVRFLRRGHQRRQPYGPQSSLRKWIHVEPAWVNREVSVVAVRAHRMDTKKEEP